MHRYSKCTVGAYTYKGKNAKKNFISDFCEELQRIKKNLDKYARRIREHFIIETEFWDVTILVEKDKFIVEDCVATINLDTLNQRDVKFCCNYNSNGIKDNEFRNITELRDFLKREVLKEDD